MPNHTELLELLLNNRGIKKGDREKFLNPSYEDHLYDPYLLKDMDKAVSRILKAIEKEEKIVIYSDYDCDGIPAAVIMHDFLDKINYKNFSVYIPDRHDEGYGLNMESIDEFAKDKVNLLITFDLGITAIDEVDKANKNGIDVIITDHHLPSSLGLPKAYAIVDPKIEFDPILNRNEDKMPAKLDDDSCSGGICGAAISYKLVEALIIKNGEKWNIDKGWEKWLLDMVGLATLADQVPLVDENRVFAYYGLKVLQKTRRFGLLEIFHKASVNISKLNEEDITFTLAPRLNAASRMDSPMRAFELLATKDLVEARTLADHLIKINDDRKHIVAQIMKDVKKKLTKKFSERDLPFVVIGNPEWKIGILGIIASKIVDEYKKTVFVWGSDGSGMIRGSCRSFGDVNLVEIMKSLPEKSLLSFGGHALAGGFAVSCEEIHFLEERLIPLFNNPKDSISEEKKEVDAIISLDDVNSENYNVIEKLAPYGTGNPKPTFLFKDVIISKIKEFGKDKNHLELIFLNSKNREVKAIAFFKTRESYNSDKKFELKDGAKVNMIASFEKNTFAGRTELRLRIIDVI